MILIFLCLLEPTLSRAGPPGIAPADDLPSLNSSDQFKKLSASTGTSTGENTLFWKSFMIKGGGGLFAVIGKDGDASRVDPMIQLGIEKGWILGEHIYLGTDLTWYAFVPDSFQDQRITLSGSSTVSSALLIAIPIPHLQLGYITKDDLLISIGPAYFWGVTATVRKPISKSFFLNAEATWFLDRAFFDTGLHDLYLNILVGLRL